MFARFRCPAITKYNRYIPNRSNDDFMKVDLDPKSLCHNIQLVSHIKELCNKIETRPIRQDLLFSNYVSHVKFTRLEYGHYGNHVNMKELADKFKLEPYDIMSSLHRTHYKPSNIFRQSYGDQQNIRIKNFDDLTAKGHFY
jgi:hypothetical protein